MILFPIIASIIIYIYIVKKYKETTYYYITHNNFLSVYLDKGKLGEYFIYKKLMQYEYNNGRFLFNLYIPKENGETTEIDVILITTKGIFIFESKNYSGWIFGNANSKMWMQTLPAGKGKSQKKQFYNPIFQNNIHIKNLRNILSEDIKMYSIITFSERCELKKVPENTEIVKIIKRNYIKEIVDNIYNFNIDIIDNQKVSEIYKKLYPYSQVDKNIKMQHIQNIEDTHK